MRKALGLVFLGVVLVVGLACSGESSTPTDPSVAATSNLQNVSGAAKPPKDFLCHRNESDPYGVVAEVSAKNLKRHSDHLYETYKDCIWLPGEYCGDSGVTCDPSASYWDGSKYVCNPTC